MYLFLFIISYFYNLYIHVIYFVSYEKAQRYYLCNIELSLVFQTLILSLENNYTTSLLTLVLYFVCLFISSQSIINFSKPTEGLLQVLNTSD